MKKTTECRSIVFGFVLFLHCAHRIQSSVEVFHNNAESYRWAAVQAHGTRESVENSATAFCHLHICVPLNASQR